MDSGQPLCGFRNDGGEVWLRRLQLDGAAAFADDDRMIVAVEIARMLVRGTVRQNKRKRGGSASGRLGR